MSGFASEPGITQNGGFMRQRRGDTSMGEIERMIVRILQQGGATLLVLLMLAWGGPAASEEPAEELADEQPQAPLISISPETTVITEPLRSDGYVDYVAALNEHFGEGVTPENNALVGYLRAYGPQAVPLKVRPRFYELLGIDPLPENGEYFLPFYEYVEQELAGEDRTKAEEEYFAEEREDWSLDSYPHLADWLEVNRGPLDAIVAASEKSRFYQPLVCPEPDGGSWDTVFNSFDLTQLDREAVRALSMRALFRAGAGDVAGALNDLDAGHRLARHHVNGPYAIDQIMAYGLDMIVFENEKLLLNQGKLTAEESARLRRQLESLPSLPPLVETMELGERYFALDGVATVCRRGPEYLQDLREMIPGGNLAISAKVDSEAFRLADWDQILRNINQRNESLCQAMRIADRQQRKEALRTHDQELADRLQRFTNPRRLFWMISTTPAQEVATEYLTLELLFPFPIFDISLPGIEDFARLRYELACTGATLAEYRAREGEYPESLQQLVPGLLGEVPADRFTGEPLVYRRSENGYRLYSLGPNGVDDGGVDFSESGEFADMVLLVEHEE